MNAIGAIDNYQEMDKILAKKVTQMLKWKQYWL